jgi:hypothetical protein
LIQLTFPICKIRDIKGNQTLSRHRRLDFRNLDINQVSLIPLAFLACEIETNQEIKIGHGQALAVAICNITQGATIGKWLSV